jgi:hypothetical protein
MATRHGLKVQSPEVSLASTNKMPLLPNTEQIVEKYWTEHW